MAEGTWIALLRGINVGGRHKVAMPVLRALCAGLGWQDARTYIQSGNVVFRAGATAAELEARLEEAIAGALGLTIPVIVRSATDWGAYARGNPFPGPSRDEPNLVMLALAKAPLRASAAAGLRERAADGEQIAQAGEALWIHYAGGAGRSKLTPTLLDRLAGSPVTTRNWRTVLALDELAGGPC